MDFKQYRSDKKLSQVQAGALVGRSESFWSELETGKAKPHKAAAAARILWAMENSPEVWQKLMATQPEIKALLSMGEQHGLSQGKLSALIGGGPSTLGNLKIGINPMNEFWRRSIAAMQIELMVKASQPEVVSEPTQNEALPVQPEKAITHHVIEKPITHQVNENDGFEQVMPRIIDGEPLWIVADVCRAIGYSNPRVAKDLARPGDVKKVTASDSMGREQEQWAVNEYGLLRILAKANTAKTEPFERWVFEEVLPQIRKTGAYSVQPQQSADPIDALIYGLQEIKTLKHELSQVRMIAEQASASQVTTRDVITDLQRLNARKSQLHDLVQMIVAKCKTLPETDIEGQHFAKYNNVWRFVHRAAQPPVARLDDYTTLAQVQTAINAAESLLVRMGGIMTVQARIEELERDQ